MKNRTNIAPETRAFVSQLYLVESLPPRDIVERLKTELDVTLSSDALRQLIHRLGLPEKRKAAEIQIAAALDPGVVAQNRISKATKTLERWQGGAERIVDKAIAAADGATGLRDLSLATATAVQGTKLFMLTSGFEESGRRPSAGPTFDIYFSSSPDSPFSVEGRARHEAAKNVTPVPAADEASDRR